MLNFYRLFIPSAARILALYKLTKPKNFKWSSEANKAFEEAKAALTRITTITFPSSDAKFSLRVDASDTAIGAVLYQQQKG